MVGSIANRSTALDSSGGREPTNVSMTVRAHSFRSRRKHVLDRADDALPSLAERALMTRRSDASMLGNEGRAMFRGNMACPPDRGGLEASDKVGCRANRRRLLSVRALLVHSVDTERATTMTTLTEFVVRFFAGGLVVSAFAVVGEMWKPKSFGGLFGAAPSVALVTIALAFAKHGDDYVAKTATAMVGGAIAMFVYASLCARLARIRGIPVWLEAGLAWFSWLVLAGAIYASFRFGGAA